MKTTRRAFPVLVFALCCTTQAGDYLVEDAGWLGNTWNGNNNQWVQHNAADICVYDGRIFTNSRWDENKRSAGIYSTNDGTPLEKLDNVHNGGGKVPGPAVTAGPTYVFASWAIHHEKRSNNRAWYGVARCFHDGSAAPFGDSHILIIHELDQTAVDMESRVSGLVVYHGNGIDELYVSDPIDSAIRVYDVAGMQFIRSFPVSGDPGDLCFDAAGHLWLIDRSSHIVKKYSRNGIDLKRDISDTKLPVDICSDATTGNLVVADGHHSRQHLRFYNVSDDPVVKSTWGESVLMSCW